MIIGTHRGIYYDTVTGTVYGCYGVPEEGYEVRADNIVLGTYSDEEEALEALLTLAGKLNGRTSKVYEMPESKATEEVLEDVADEATEEVVETEDTVPETMEVMDIEVEDTSEETDEDPIETRVNRKKRVIHRAK